MQKLYEKGETCVFKIQEKIITWRGSRRLIIFIVAIALLLDNMLLTSVVPIIPSFLYKLRHEEKMTQLNQTVMKAQHEKLIENANQDNLNSNLKPGLLNKLHPNLIKTNQNEKHGKIDENCGLNLQKNQTGTKTNLDTNEDYEDEDKESNQATNNSEISQLVLKNKTVEKILKHEELVHENMEVGLMFASKPIIQAAVNPFVGSITNKIGYSIPMFIGFFIMFISTIIFAIGSTYPVLLFARCLQGIGSACTSVAGIGMLADRYPDDRERGNAMALALGGLALGVLIGPPFGGVMYQFFGKASPFIVLAFLALFDGLLQLLVLQPKIHKEETEGPSIKELIQDPYILIASGAITVANIGVAILEPALPLWMIDRMNSSNFEQGAAFLPCSIAYLIGTNAFGSLGYKMGRWLASMCGILIIGIALLLIPQATSFDDLILPNGLIGFAIGMVDSSMMPMLGYLVDIRHTSVYGSVYAIGDVAFCTGFVIGPALASTLVSWFGFEGLVTTTAIICFIYAPFMLLLRNPPIFNETQTLIQSSSMRYTSYTNEETQDVEKGDVEETLLT